MSERKIIARRAAFELKANSVVNLGIGMPEGVACGRQRREDHRPHHADRRARRHRRRAGGRHRLRRGDATRRRSSTSPTSSTSTTAAGSTWPSSASRRSTGDGNLNVSKFGPKLAGAGGFINISQNAKEVVFVGTFGAGRPEGRGSRTAGCVIDEEAKCKKFVRRRRARHVQRRLRRPSAARACSTSPSAACSRCARDGLELVEVAPGIDIERDILARMDFTPLILRDRRA